MRRCCRWWRSRKPPERRGKVLFIDAANEIARERGMSFLRPEHQARIASAYASFTDVENFAAVATLGEIGALDWNLSIPLYVRRSTPAAGGEAKTLGEAWAEWDAAGRTFWTEMDAVVEMLDGIVGEMMAVAGDE